MKFISIYTFQWPIQSQKKTIPAKSNFGSISFGNLTTNPTASMNMPNNSSPLAA